MKSLDTEEKRGVHRPLFEAGKLRCPHDKKLHDILTYKKFSLSKDFETQLNVVLRCAFCSHIFSPHLNDQEMNLIEEVFN